MKNEAADAKGEVENVLHQMAQMEKKKLTATDAKGYQDGIN